MKTSFYFVIWIVIFPIIRGLNNDFIYNNSFLLAIIIVWGLSWLLNGLMPNIMAYEKELKTLPILEDVYNGNIASFKRRLQIDTTIAIITSLYFIISTAVIVSAIFEYGINGWYALIFFVFFTYRYVSLSFKFYKSNLQLNKNPVTGVCIEICKNIYKLDYWNFECDRDHIPYKDMLPSVPKFFKIFKIISIVFAGIAMILGFLFIFVGISGIIGHVSFSPAIYYVMYFLYGSLATYFGIRDIISGSSTLTGRKTK